MSITRILALYGIIGGLIVAIPVDWLVLSRTPEWVSGNMMLFTYLAMIVALTAVFLGIKHYRDKTLGGVIGFVPALLVGLGISAVASLIYALCWEASLALTGFDFAGSYAKQMVEAARARGVSPAELQRVMADADAFAKSYGSWLYRIPVTFLEMFPVGVLISLISAGLLRNPRVLPARAPT
jgi:hypothetical protein